MPPSPRGASSSTNIATREFGLAEPTCNPVRPLAQAAFVPRTLSFGAAGTLFLFPASAPVSTVGWLARPVGWPAPPVAGNSSPGNIKCAPPVPDETSARSVFQSDRPHARPSSARCHIPAPPDPLSNLRAVVPLGRLADAPCVRRAVLQSALVPCCFQA